jgi:hypothetical protein
VGNGDRRLDYVKPMSFSFVCSYHVEGAGPATTSKVQDRLSNGNADQEEGVMIER